MVSSHQSGSRTDCDADVETSNWQDLLSRLRAVVQREEAPQRWLAVWRLIVSHRWYQQELCRRAYWELGKTHSPLHWLDDVRQDAMLFLARDLQQADDLDQHLATRLPSWLERVIQVDCRHAIRRLRRFQETVGDVVAYYPDDRPEVEDRIDLDWATQRLEQPYRTVVVLRLNGRSVAEIADHLSLQTHTVYRLLRRGIWILRQSLAAEQRR